MPRRLTPLRLRAVEVVWLGAAMLGLALGHIALAQGTHQVHVIHVSVAALYVAPVLGAALWFGLRGGVIASALATLAFSIHMSVAWRAEPIELVERWSFIAVFWIVGIVAGVLVDLQAAETARSLAREREAERRSVVEALATLAAALGSHDPYVHAHGERVAEVAAALAAELQLDTEEVESVRLAGRVHDVGKLGVPNDILLKPGELSADERIAVQRHPEIAAEILEPLRGAARVADIVRAHHEAPDGSGYPLGLRDGEIPVGARILRVADVFCSLVDARPYKPALPIAEVLAIMTPMAGTKLDAEAFRALKEWLRRTGAVTSAESRGSGAPVESVPGR